MNFVLRTAHAVEKKKGGHTIPDVRTIIIIIIIYEKSQMYHPCGARFARPIMYDAKLESWISSSNNFTHIQKKKFLSLLCTN